MGIRKAKLNEGRALVRAADLDGFMAWHESIPVYHRPDSDLVREKLGAWMERDTDAALRIFDAVYAKASLTSDVLLPLLKAARILLIAAGALGGVVYLAQSCG